MSASGLLQGDWLNDLSPALTNRICHHGPTSAEGLFAAYGRVSRGLVLNFGIKLAANEYYNDPAGIVLSYLEGPPSALASGWPRLWP